MSAARGCGSASASTRTRPTWTPCSDASRRSKVSADGLGGGRAVERQDDGEAPGAVLRLRAAGEGCLAEGDAEQPLGLAVRRKEWQQQTLAVAWAVRRVVEAAQHHAHRRCLDAGEEIPHHTVAAARGDGFVEGL